MNKFNYKFLIMISNRKNNNSTKVFLTSVTSNAKNVDEKPHHMSTDQMSITQSVYDSDNDNGGFEEYDEKGELFYF